jgi:S-formylglutathione hydrolase FrmB
MNKHAAGLALLVVAIAVALPTGPALAQQGSVHERLTLDSALMGEAVHYSLYLPSDYETSTRSYPVVYLLHGYSDDDTGWIQMGEINRLVDAAVASGKLPPMIIVMPDGGVSWYIDNADGSVPWESMFLQELIPHVESEYRIRGTRRHRAIAGLSMGGWGALTLAMRHSDLFAGAGAFSAAVFTDDGLASWDQEGFDFMLGPVFGRGLTGEGRLTEHFRAHSPLAVAGQADVEQLRQVRYWIDCGDDDFLSAGNGQLHVLLTEREVRHEYRVRDGGHVWEYWRTGIVAGLEYVTQGFR